MRRAPALTSSCWENFVSIEPVKDRVACHGRVPHGCRLGGSRAGVGVLLGVATDAMSVDGLVLYHVASGSLPHLPPSRLEVLMLEWSDVWAMMSFALTPFAEALCDGADDCEDGIRLTVVWRISFGNKIWLTQLRRSARSAWWSLMCSRSRRGQLPRGPRVHTLARREAEALAWWERV